MGVETEVKLAATPEMLARLLADPRLAGPERREHLVSTYFDTPDSRLHRAGACLRVRERRHASEPNAETTREQTLKLASPRQGAIHRQEWNIAIPGTTPDAARWPETPRAMLAELLAGGEPLPLGATHVTRVRRRIRHGATIIDIMADTGEIRPATPTHTSHHPACHRAIAELELELVEGDPADLFALAATLPLGPGLIWMVTGKGARCRAIARDVPFRAVTATAPPLSPAMDVAAGFHAIGWSCLGHLLANYPLVLANGDPEAVHQSRVAIRRLRAAFSLFGEAVADAETSALRAGFKSAASALAPARDRHVLLENLAAAAGDPPAAETAALLAHLTQSRDAATAEAQAFLMSEPFQRLLVNFALWLERGAWRAHDAAAAALPASVSALLARRQRKLRRLAKAADTHDDEQLHALRIEIKKLRYAIAFFAPLFAAGEARRQLRAQEKLLAGLQDVLGDLHDIATAADQADLFADLAPADAALLAAELSRHTAALAGQRPRLLRRAAKLLAKNADTPRWWAA